MASKKTRNTKKNKRSSTGKKRPCTLPKVTLRTNRSENTNLQLHFLEGSLPADCRGHVFFPAPLPDPAGVNPFVNGDACHYRLDLEGGAGAKLTWKIARDPTFNAEQGTKTLKHDSWDFMDFGIAKMSPTLGARVFPHTALVPIKVDVNGHPRDMLLATYDAGRPYLLDPKTMSIVGAVGKTQEWRGSFLLDTPFKLIFSSAHPVWDEATGELITTNFRIDFEKMLSDLKGLFGTFLPRATLNLLADDPTPEHLATWADRKATPAIERMAQRCQKLRGKHPDEPWTESEVRMLRGLLPDDLDAGTRMSTKQAKEAENAFAAFFASVAMSLKTAFGVITAPGFLPTLLRSVDDTLDIIKWLVGVVKIVSEFLKEGELPGELSKDPWTYLVKWKGPGQPLERFEIVTPDGDPVVISSSAHQLVMTDKHIIILDAALKFEADLLLSIPTDFDDRLTRVVRRALSNPQPSETKLYLVKRADLQGPPNSGPATFPARMVVATPVVVNDHDIPRETVHFLADHHEHKTDGKDCVRVYAIHQCAMDGGEFVLEGDRLATGPTAYEHTWGMFPCATDINRIARYDIDTKTGDVIGTPIVVADKDLTWTVGLAAGLGVPGYGPPRPTHDELWFYGQGLLPELVTDRVFDLYEHYPWREYSTKKVLGFLKEGGIPPSLFKMDMTTMTIVDKHILKPGQFMASPQAINAGGKTYIVATVYSDDTDVIDESELAVGGERQFWVFDGADLRKPVARMTHKALDFPHTIHTAFLPSLPADDTTLVPDWKADFEPTLNNDEQRQFFEDHVY